MPWHAAPLPLVAVGAVAVLLALAPLGWLGSRVVRALLRRPRKPAGLVAYGAAIVAASLLGGVGIASLGLALALGSYRALGKKTRVAEVRCHEIAPQKLRLFFTPIASDGRLGPTESYNLDGDEWTVGGDVLRFRPFLSALGVETVFAVTRIEGRWLHAADADAHPATAYDRRGGTSRGWLMLYRDGTRGPLGWLIAGVHGQAVSQLPSAHDTYEVYVTPNGFVLEH